MSGGPIFSMGNWGMEERGHITPSHQEPEDITNGSFTLKESAYAWCKYHGKLTLSY